MKSILSALLLVLFFSVPSFSANDELGNYTQLEGTPKETAVSILGSSTEFERNAEDLKSFIKSLSEKKSVNYVKGLNGKASVQVQRITTILDQYLFRTSKTRARLYELQQSQLLYIWQTLKDLKAQGKLKQFLNLVDTLKSEYANLQGEKVKKVESFSARPELDAKTFFGENPAFRDQIYKDLIKVIDDLNTRTARGETPRGFLSTSGKTDILVERFSTLLDHILFTYENGNRLRYILDSAEKLSYLEELLRKYPDTARMKIEEMYTGKAPQMQSIPRGRSLVATPKVETNEAFGAAPEDPAKMTPKELRDFVEKAINGTTTLGRAYGITAFSFAVALSAVSIYKFKTEYPSNPRIFDELRDEFMSPAFYSSLAPFVYLQMEYEKRYGSGSEAAKVASANRALHGLNVFESKGFPDLARRSGKLFYASAKMSGLFMIPIAASQVIGGLTGVWDACQKVKHSKGKISNIKFEEFQETCANGYSQFAKSEAAQQFMVDMTNSFVTGLIFFTGAQVAADARHIYENKRAASQATKASDFSQTLSKNIKVAKGNRLLPATLDDVARINAALKANPKGVQVLFKTVMRDGKAVLQTVFKIGRTTAPITIFVLLYEIVDHYMGLQIDQTFTARRVNDSYIDLTNTLNYCLPFYSLTDKNRLPPGCMNINVLEKLEEYSKFQTTWHNKLTKETQEIFKDWVLYYNEMINRYSAAKNFYRDIVWQIQYARKNNMSFSAIDANSFKNQFYDQFDRQQKNLSAYNYLPFMKVDPFFGLQPDYMDAPTIEVIQGLSKTKSEKKSLFTPNATILKITNMTHEASSELQKLSLKMQPRFVGLMAQLLENELKIRKDLSRDTSKKIYNLLTAFKSKRESVIAEALFELEYESSLNRKQCFHQVRDNNPMGKAFQETIFSILSVYSSNEIRLRDADRFLDTQMGFTPLRAEYDYFDENVSTLDQNQKCIFEQIRQALYDFGTDTTLFPAGVPIGPGGSYAYDYEYFLELNGMDSSTRDTVFHGRRTKSMVEYLLLSMVCGPDDIENNDGKLESDRFLFNDRGWRGIMHPPRITKGPAKPELCNKDVSNAYQKLVHDWKTEAPLSYISRQRHVLPARAEIETLSLFYPLKSDGKTYANIMDYIYQNFDDSVVSKEFIGTRGRPAVTVFSSYEKWWEENIEPQYVRLLTLAYEEFRQEILLKKYYPLLHKTNHHNDKWYAEFLAGFTGQLKMPLPMGILNATRVQVNFYFDHVLEPMYNRLHVHNPLLTKEHFVREKEKFLDSLSTLFLVAERADSEDLKDSVMRLEESIESLRYLFGFGLSTDENERESKPFFIIYPDDLIKGVSNVYKFDENRVKVSNSIVAKQVIGKALKDLIKAALSATEATQMSNLFFRE